jgi:GH15 family glucan-1,4-alpha-glucosidase
MRAPSIAEARLLFERMLGHANHLGFCAEQTNEQGEALGNFPQTLPTCLDQCSIQLGSTAR